jgi:molybdopterin synthase catalytic subunit
MSAIVRFALSPAPIEGSGLAAALDDPAAGALVTFEGRVRNHNAGQAVARLEYQAYPALAHNTGQRILEEEARRHGLLGAHAVHRTGVLDIGEIAVWVGVAAAHRGAAFDAARAMLERLKHELPVWKKETYADGRIEWVGPDNQSPETSGERPDQPDLPEWQAELCAIYLSAGHDFRGRHGQARMDHGIVEVDQVECVAGMGLRGDRYFGHQADFKGQVTFFDVATVEAVRKRFNVPALPAAAFRRNLLVSGVALGDWIGKRFCFQGIEFEGAEECRPCYWMDAAVGAGVEDFLRPNCGGGLRARILTNGALRISNGRRVPED